MGASSENTCKNTGGGPGARIANRAPGWDRNWRAPPGLGHQRSPSWEPSKRPSERSAARNVIGGVADLM